ncbi:CRISPR-associated endonuclease Cas3'' [Pyrococcus abyssi]|nr:HD domain-containing protein [Pyrococcus abyssi]
MEDHIREGLKFIERMYISRNYGEFLSRVLNLRKEKAEGLLRKAYIIHDVGKGLEEFQSKKQHFPYHEFYSALVAKEVLKDFGKAGEIAVVAVSLHHHDWVRYEKPRKPDNLELDRECACVIEKFMGVEIPRKVPWIKPEEFSRWVVNVFSSNIRAVYALLLPISLADNYSAMRNRGGEPTTPGKEIEEVLSVYKEVEKFVSSISSGI